MDTNCNNIEYFLPVPPNYFSNPFELFQQKKSNSVVCLDFSQINVYWRDPHGLFKLLFLSIMKDKLPGICTIN